MKKGYLVRYCILCYIGMMKAVSRFYCFRSRERKHHYGQGEEGQ